MRRSLYALLASLILATTNIVASAQQAPTSSLRVEAEGTNLQKHFFEVVLPKPYKTTPAPDVTLYTNSVGEKVAITPYTGREIAENPELAKRFRIYLTQPADPAATYSLTLQYTDVDGNAQNRAISKLTADYEVEMTTQDPNCLGQMSVNIVFTTSDKAYLQERVSRIHDWLSKKSNLAIKSVRTEPVTSRDVLEKKVAQTVVTPADVDKAKRDGGLSLCMQMGSGLPFDTFDASVLFNDNAPIELKKPFYAKGIAARTRVVPARADIDTRQVGARPLERNLDLGVAFTSSVLDMKKPDNRTVRGRDNVGTLDLLLAPFLNNKRGRISFEDLASKGPNSRYDLVTFWTPIFFDAKISTKPITQETISTNRVVVGTEREWRWYGRSKFDDIFRLITRASNASDRDFKRAEFKGSVEFIPLLGRLNHAIVDRSDFIPMEIDPEHRMREIPATFGWELRPLIGTEFGRTYVRGRPAEFLTKLPRENVRRAYFGMDLVLNFKSVTLTMSDLFYIRGESKTDRKQNYFLGQLDLPLSDLSNEHIAQSIFMAFERGKLPPFNKVGINAFKIGYRIRSVGWFDRYR